MVGLDRIVSTVADERVILALGGLNLLGAADQLLLVVTGATVLDEGLTNAALVGGAGIALLYWGLSLSRSDIAPAVRPRIAGWSLAGPILLLLLVVFLGLDSGGPIVPSREIAEIAVAVGSVGGYTIGRNEARAVARAREAESHRRELEAHRSQLQQQNERLESFAGMLAHELRNPVQIAQIYHPQERPRDEDAAERVEKAIDRIDEMIDILLVIVRESEVSIEDEPVAIADVATRSWTDLSTGVEDANLVVETERVVRADPAHVEHLLRNLFRNSIEHGGRDVSIRVGDLVGGFYVEDDGPGISDEIRQDVVEAGFSTKDDGIGLGLTFVTQLSAAYGWQLTIADSEAGGARFEFTVVEDAPTAEEPPRN